MQNQDTRLLFDRCVRNARCLLDSAKDLSHDDSRLHIAHHLTILALEEIGKGVIVLIHGEALTDKLGWLDDHVKKIFWALWSFALSKKSVSSSEIATLKHAARGMHEFRLRALYVDVAREKNEIVDRALLDSLLAITEARLSSEEIAHPAELTSDEKLILDWFLAHGDDPRVQSIMYSSESFDYLDSAQGNVRAWIKWIKDKHEYWEQFNLELAKKEMSRVPQEQDTKVPKWRIVVRLQALAHTMTQKVLVEWNKQKWHITLSGGSGQKELRVQIIFPKQIPLEHLWAVAFSDVMAFVAALNIGSRGMFWWYTPDFTTEFYESLYDVETNAPFKINASPSPAPVWDKTEPINKHDIINIQAVYIYIQNSQKHDPVIFHRYLRGLALLMKSDLFHPFAGDCIQEFYLALQAFFKQQGFWDGRTTFEDAVISKLNVPDDLNFRRLARLAESVTSNPAASQAITGSDAAMAKMYFDSIMIGCARDFLKETFGKQVDRGVHQAETKPAGA
jgi:AbiV family abortive infection protein